VSTNRQVVDEPRAFQVVDDLSTGELATVLDRAAAGKRDLRRSRDGDQLAGHTLAMLFEKPSTRTRVSFETGMTQLGGHAIFLGPGETHLGDGEPVADTARSLSRYVDAIVARLFDHDDLAALADHATVPVVNGLTDDAHPCQALADLLTVREQLGNLDGATAAWVGDGNNVGRSFAVACAMAGVDLRVATPEGYGLGGDALERAGEFGGPPTVVDTPQAAVEGADVVYTDVWVSMGQEDERDRKLLDFEGYQVDEALLAGTDAAFMHCLPANRGEEVTADVLEGERSLAFDQAENRLHVQKALLSFLLGGDPATLV
jgi:ornithine carbamoyltransferase